MIKSAGFFSFRGSFMCAPFVVAVWLIPESPAFLINNGKEDQADDIMDKLGFDDHLRYQLHTKFNKKYQPPPVEGTWMKRLRNTLTKSENMKPFLSGLVMMLFFQVSSFNINEIFLVRLRSPSLSLSLFLIPQSRKKP